MGGRFSSLKGLARDWKLAAWFGAGHWDNGMSVLFLVVRMAGDCSAEGRFVVGRTGVSNCAQNSSKDSRGGVAESFVASSPIVVCSATFWSGEAAAVVGIEIGELSGSDDSVSDSL